MEKKSEALVKNKLTRKILSFSVGKDELYKFYKILQERSYAAGDIEVSHFKQGEQSDEDYEKNKITLKEAFELKLTVMSKDGQELWGSISDIFESSNFPDDIKSIYLSSDTPLKVSYNWIPRNSFQLFLDFSKPDMLNMSFLPSQETPNESKISVEGFDATWVHGVFNEVSNFIDKAPSKLTWLHKHSVYDLLVWILGLPFGFWVAYKLSETLNNIFGLFSIFVKSASYVYVFLASLIGFRILFHYARWIWPMVEYKSPKNKALKHRLTLGAIVLSLTSSIISDILRAIF